MLSESQECWDVSPKARAPPGDCFGSSSFPLNWEAPVQLFVTLAILYREEKGSQMSRDRPFRAVQGTSSFCNLPGKPVCRQVCFSEEHSSSLLLNHSWDSLAHRSFPDKTHTSSCRRRAEGTLLSWLPLGIACQTSVCYSVSQPVLLFSCQP